MPNRRPPRRGWKSMPRTVEGERARVPERLRIDKWLWAARFYKTRATAAQAVEAGQVRVGDERVKPAHSVSINSQLCIRKHGLLWTIVVTGLSDRRGGAADAALLYRETEASVGARKEETARRAVSAASAPTWTARPTKRDRRRLLEFLDKA